uniref:Uncharacterized protein n=1 Tax=Arundo donax TaxID=35708 RepID=A0A0A9D2T8_ARUDO
MLLWRKRGKKLGMFATRLGGSLLLWMLMLQHSCAVRGLPAQTIAQSSCGPRNMEVL